MMDKSREAFEAYIRRRAISHEAPKSLDPAIESEAKPMNKQDLINALKSLGIRVKGNEE